MAITLRSDFETTIGATRQTSITLTKPTGTADGDVMVVHIASNNGTVTVTDPGGWTACPSSPVQNATGSTLAAFYKVAASEGASYVFSVGATARSLCGWIGSYQGVDTADPVDTSTTATGAAATLVLPSITLGAAGMLVICGIIGNGGNGETETFTEPGGFTEECDQHTVIVTSSESSQGVFDQVFSSSGSTGTMTITLSSSIAAESGIATSFNPTSAPDADVTPTTVVATAFIDTPSVDTWTPETNADELFRVTTGSRW